MRCRYWMLLVVILPVGLAGCGNSGDPANRPAATDQAAQGDEGTGEQAQAAPQLSEPAAALYAFLEAVRTGDDQKADSMLTALARKKTAEMNMVVAPPGSDTARFEVGKVDYLPEDRASVVCTWTDRDDSGKPRTDEITWVLRKEPEGWRIGGMVATMFSDRPPTFLNFEDPEDMLRQQQMLQEELQRRATEAKAQVQRPEPPESGKNPIRR